MARIRTVKPEFWDSPSTAAASPWARLAYIAMWNWADDYGRGTANLKELEGFIFPNDTFPQQWSGNTVTFRSIVAEISDCFDVTFYDVDGRPYYAVSNWEKHQRNEKRAASSRYPGPPANHHPTRCDDGGADLPTISAVSPRVSALGTGEQGNRGTGVEATLADAPDPQPATKRRKAVTKDMPTDWQPSTTCERYASDHGLDVNREAEKFTNHHLAKGSQFADWDRAFRGWLAKSAEWKRPGDHRRPSDDSWEHLKRDPDLDED